MVDENLMDDEFIKTLLSKKKTQQVANNDVVDCSEELTMEDRLKAIAYQFVALYERWSEDRQLAAKQSAEEAELIHILAKHVKEFKDLESIVRGQMVNSIKFAMQNATNEIGRSLGEKAWEATEEIVRQLDYTTANTGRVFHEYQQELKTNRTVLVLVTVFTTIIASIFIAKFALPTPTLPLTAQQVDDLYQGQVLREIWPKLSEKEQKHFRELEIRRGLGT